MANIMQQFRAKNRVTRDGYDLSKRLCFTAKAGELLPTYSRLMMVGDEFDFSNKWETTTAPVNTSAYTRFKEYFDWFFVPINLLWNRFNGWSTGIKELSSYATSINGSSTLTDDHPFFSTSQIQDYLSELEGNEDYNTNFFGFSRAQNTRKLLSYLGYGDFYNTNTIDDLVLSPWRLLAYQKIYQDYYRNSQWEAFSYERYNLMYLNGQSDSLQIPTDQLDLSRQTLFDLQYANWNKDLFMGVLPNSQYGDAASIDLSVLKGDSLTDYSSYLANNVVTSSSLSLTSDQVRNLGRSLGLSNSSATSLTSSFTVLAIRQAEAMQKYKEITQSNVLDFPSQKEAHFDYRPNEAYSERCRRIGGIDNDIKISAVINNNITKVNDNEVNAANVAGYGHSQKFGNGRKFKADVDGVLMCIYHVVPLLDYALPRVEPDNLKTSFTDYAVPEFDRTGMVQVPLAWMTNTQPSDDAVNFQSRLIGYAPNYIEYKTDIDEVKGAFYNGGLEAWVAPIDNSYFMNFITSGGRPGPVFRGINYTWFKINPSITDNIFSGEVSNDNVSSDKFWVNCYHDVSAVRPLDRIGLPY